MKNSSNEVTWNTRQGKVNKEEHDISKSVDQVHQVDPTSDSSRSSSLPSEIIKHSGIQLVVDLNSFNLNHPTENRGVAENPTGENLDNTHSTCNKKAEGKDQKTGNNTQDSRDTRNSSPVTRGRSQVGGTRKKHKKKNDPSQKKSQKKDTSPISSNA